VVAGLALMGAPTDLPGRFRPRDVAIYRPYPDEIPWDLLEARRRDAPAHGDAEEVAEAGVDPELMRVAKHHGEVVGAYVIRPLTPTRYELCSLVVASPYRRRGLGSWLLGHAIGLAETKGGREILIRQTPSQPLFRDTETGVIRDTETGLFVRAGFVASGDDLLLTLTPE
jgi:GNAT superfamily N-acetyltransferase